MRKILVLVGFLSFVPLLIWGFILQAATRVGFQLAQTVLAQLKVYDLHGRELATLFDAVVDPGNYEVELDVSTLSSGIYFYCLQAGDFVQTKKFTLLQ